MIAIMNPIEKNPITPEIRCLAQNIFYESRSEKDISQIAVGYVTINRITSDRYPNSICKVIKEKHGGVCQFSWVCHPQHVKWNEQDKQDWQKALQIAILIMTKKLPDPTNGSLYFFDKRLSMRWTKSKKYQYVGIIGSHKYYKDRE